MDAGSRDEAAQVLGHRAAADQNAGQALGARDERERLQLAAETAAADAADNRDRTADTRRRQRALERVAAADFEDQVDSATVREVQHALVPFGLRAIVDRGMCAERASTIELAVVARSHDRVQAGGGCKLQGPDRYAARALDQYAVAALQPGGNEQCIPGRDAGAWQSRGLDVAQVRRNREPRVLVQYDLLRQHAVPAAAEAARNLVLRR